MLSRENNELICQVGPGTAMGKAFRRFWVPALLSEELPAPNQTCPMLHKERIPVESFLLLMQTESYMVAAWRV